MKLSARARYAARILLELAKNNGQAPISASTLSQHTGVSVQFVEQILKPLKQKGLTLSVRGAAGGHRLAKPAAAISLGEIVRVMEGGILLSVCCGDKANNCTRQGVCLTRKAWLHVSKTLEKELDTINLCQLLHSEDVCMHTKTVDPPKRLTRAVLTKAPAAALEPPPRVGLRKVKGLRRIIR